MLAALSNAQDEDGGCPGPSPGTGATPPSAEHLYSANLNISVWFSVKEYKMMENLLNWQGNINTVFGFTEFVLLKIVLLYLLVSGLRSVIRKH